MKNDVSHADGRSFGDVGHRGVCQVRYVHNRHSARALHTDDVIGGDEGGGVFVETESDRERVVGEGGQEAPEPVCLIGIRLHILVRGGTYDIASRQAYAT